MDFGNSKTACLILSDGTVFKGKSFGKEGTVIGETVFTTARTGNHGRCSPNFRCEDTVDSFLKKYGIIGIYDIDTRRLTRIIRETGVMNGMITTEEFQLEKALAEIRAYKVGKVVPKVGIRDGACQAWLQCYGYALEFRR